MFFSKQDVYINVVGRMRLDRGSQEGCASDLAVAVSLVSSFVSIPVRSDTCFVGEIGLLGELRPVPALEKRIQEARRMGFSRVVTPRAKGSKQKAGGTTTFSRANGIDWIQCDRLLDAINEGLVAKLPKARRRQKPKDSVDGATPPGSAAPGSLEDLMLDNVINDDDDDDDIPFS
jgi:ATP-dependent Lon protease